MLLYITICWFNLHNWRNKYGQGAIGENYKYESTVMEWIFADIDYWKFTKPKETVGCAFTIPMHSEYRNQVIKIWNIFSICLRAWTGCSNLKSTVSSSSDGHQHGQVLKMFLKNKRALVCNTHTNNFNEDGGDFNQIKYYSFSVLQNFFVWLETFQSR